LIDFPVDRASAVQIARSTCSLLLHELRRYVRIPLVIEVSIDSPAGSFSGSSREISGGGMSVQLSRPDSLLDKLRVSFTLPDKSAVNIEAEICWQKATLVGFKFQDSSPARQIVRKWINSFLGLD
jgi:c-di-GMP-binding flagellar brake protein YcgR